MTFNVSSCMMDDICVTYDQARAMEEQCWDPTGHHDRRKKRAFHPNAYLIPMHLWESPVYYSFAYSDFDGRFVGPVNLRKKS